MMDSKGEEAVGDAQREIVEDTKVVLGATDERILWDEKESRAVVRKFDMRLLSLFTVINLFSFIDRVNIGNARLLGLEKDLGLSGLRFNIALMCLFVSYCVVELPSNILCKVVGGHIYIPTLVLCFGIITMLTSLVEQKGGLYACRFLLGVFEGGISPGVVFMLALFYRRHELGVRTSIYISASSASGAFGGLLAIGLSRIPPWGLIHTWRNIFFFEGLVSVILAVVAFISIPNGPENARFLTESQKQVAVDRMRIDSAGTTEHSRTTPRHIVQGLTTPPVVFCAFGFFFGNTCAQSFSLFSPSIISAMGYTNELAQLLSVGPYAAACAISIVVGYISDRYQNRGWVIFATVPFGIAGMGMLEFLPASMPGAKYGALYLAAPGIYAFLPLWLAWAVNNAATPTVKAASAGLVFTIGSLGGILAPWVYLPGDAPNYRTGHAIMFAFLFGSWAMCIGMIIYIKWENRAREMGKRDIVLDGLGSEEQLELSSRHPAFRYAV
ncbi:major facilitator superfamily domain-containing protein [Aspergillus caelatus]|uniref:Major facilitator superfamily domain-containing protein n=1 Tax=Aspergillus caelatus TaxID=61420 RepID=A0A5N7AJS5_9EURO|nr:major facilitator superfamily domain-containing protein [Aspergillus caelatus]KAE8369943.1 major facilitator superfamily domain-containing protein [Aspergillus caelatus]